jgi:hypothetical protein
MEDAKAEGIPVDDDGAIHFSKEHIPANEELAPGNAWAEFRKKVNTRAIRIEGPFRVDTSESESEPFFCEDGWLAIDARGYPYAIADDEFQLIYEPVEQPDQESPAESPEGGVLDEEAEEAPEVDEAVEIPAGLGIARAVIYRSKTGKYDLPAVVTATVATLDPEGVSLGHVPELTSPSRVHLTVFTCGKQGTSRDGNPVNNEAAGGSYQEFNIPQFVVEEIGADEEPAEIVAGTWRWPERV